jgi:hypothetical protein
VISRGKACWKWYDRLKEIGAEWGLDEIFYFYFYFIFIFFFLFQIWSSKIALKVTVHLHTIVEKTLCLHSE